MINRLTQTNSAIQFGHVYRFWVSPENAKTLVVRLKEEAKKKNVPIHVGHRRNLYALVGYPVSGEYKRSDILKVSTGVDRWFGRLHSLDRKLTEGAIKCSFSLWSKPLFRIKILPNWIKKGLFWAGASDVIGSILLPLKLMWLPVQLFLKLTVSLLVATSKIVSSKPPGLSKNPIGRPYPGDKLLAVLSDPSLAHHFDIETGRYHGDLKKDHPTLNGDR